MAILQIRKKSNKTWVHTDSVLGLFILSKFYVSADGTKFQIVEQGESKRRIYDVVDISLFDDTQGGLIEVFTNITALLLRLEQLQYPAFDTSNMPVSSIDTTATHWKGNYDIVTNQPPLADGVGQIGDERKCTTAGSRNFGSGILYFNIDDIIAYNGLVYFKKVDNNQTPTSTTAITHTQLTYTSSPIFTIPQNAQIISVVINELRHLKATKYTYNPLLATNNFEITDPTFLLDWEAGTEIEIVTQ